MVSIRKFNGGFLQCVELEISETAQFIQQKRTQDKENQWLTPSLTLNDWGFPGEVLVCIQEDKIQHKHTNKTKIIVRADQNGTRSTHTQTHTQHHTTPPSNQTTRHCDSQLLLGRVCTCPGVWFIYPLPCIGEYAISLASVHQLQIDSWLGVGIPIYFPFPVLGLHLAWTTPLK